MGGIHDGVMPTCRQVDFALPQGRVLLGPTFLFYGGGCIGCWFLSNLHLLKKMLVKYLMEFCCHFFTSVLMISLGNFEFLRYQWLSVNCSSYTGSQYYYGVDISSFEYEGFYKWVVFVAFFLYMSPCEFDVAISIYVKLDHGCWYRRGWGQSIFMYVDEVGNLLSLVCQTVYLHVLRVQYNLQNLDQQPAAAFTPTITYLTTVHSCNYISAQQFSNVVCKLIYSTLIGFANLLILGTFASIVGTLLRYLH